MTREYNTRRIQYHLYINGQYCFYEIENLGKATTNRIEWLSVKVQSVIPEEFLSKMSTMRLVIDSINKMHLYFTTRSNVGVEIFDKLKDKFFEKVFICKADYGKNAYTACFKHK